MGKDAGEGLKSNRMCVGTSDVFYVFFIPFYRENLFLTQKKEES